MVMVTGIICMRANSSTSSSTSSTSSTSYSRCHVDIVAVMTTMIARRPSVTWPENSPKTFCSPVLRVPRGPENTESGQSSGYLGSRKDLVPPVRRVPGGLKGPCPTNPEGK